MKSYNNQNGLIAPILGFLVIIIVIFCSGIFIGIKYLSSSTQLQGNVPLNSIPAQSVSSLEPKENVDSREKYTYQTFSFEYPKDWKLKDFQKDPDFFRKNKLFDNSDFGIALEKENTLLFIGISKYNSQASAGGIIISEDGLNQFLKIRQPLKIKNQLYYLRTEEESLSDFVGTPLGGLISSVSLTEVKQKGAWNKEIKINDMYDDLIQNKHGLSFAVAKFSTAGVGTKKTPENIQQEIISILGSIDW